MRLWAFWVLLGVSPLPLVASGPLRLSLSINYASIAFNSPGFIEEGEKALRYDELQTKGIETLLAEAQWIFSGIIYGFRFRYIPGNKEEGHGEAFELEPVSEIPYGDPALEVFQVIDEDQTLLVVFYYHISEAQERRLKISRGGGFHSAGGTGEVSVMEENPRMTSLKEAVKWGLREDLRSYIYNRPLELRGFVYLSAPPRIGIFAGQYRSQVNLLYKPDSVKAFPYSY